MTTSSSIIELTKALIAARKAFAPVKRESTAQVGQNRTYHYADLATLLEATMPALLDNGLAVVQAIDTTTAILVTRLLHTSGEFIEAGYPLKLDQPPQQLGSNLTYGRRYSLQSLLCLAAEDDDGAAAQPAPRLARPSKPAIKATPDGPQPSPPPDIPPAARPRHGTISQSQVRRLWAIAAEHGWPREDVRGWLIGTFSVPSSSEIKVEDYDAIIKHLEAGPPRPASAVPSAADVNDAPF